MRERELESEMWKRVVVMKIPLQFLNYFWRSGNLFYLQFIGEYLIESCNSINDKNQIILQILHSKIGLL